jgi:cytochrome bd ubiquinol oxidase subunit II
MIASIGPFWDANETWIVLGIGILLIAFPKAHGIILTALYIPVTLMLFGLILRGVAFDFRVKAGDAKKQRWNRMFFVGSLVASMSQGWMLGAYITGLQSGLTSVLFAALIALTLPALYVMLGAGWLLVKTEGALFDKAVGWGRRALPSMGFALLLVSIATPIRTSNNWVVYALLILICLMAALGLAYSIYPDIILGRMDLYEAAAATDSLRFIFYGVAVTLPVILFYSGYVFWVFRGKATDLSYE